MRDKKTPAFNFKLCVNCSVCAQACPVSCIELTVNGVDALRGLYPRVRAEGCTGCSICAKSCPVEAIAMEKAA